MIILPFITNDVIIKIKFYTLTWHDRHTEKEEGNELVDYITYYLLKKIVYGCMTILGKLLIDKYKIIK